MIALLFLIAFIISNIIVSHIIIHWGVNGIVSRLEVAVLSAGTNVQKGKNLFNISLCESYESLRTHNHILIFG
jgi:hypothetical protein